MMVAMAGVLVQRRADAPAAAGVRAMRHPAMTTTIVIRPATARRE
jgi:hypothetical protein